MTVSSGGKETPQKAIANIGAIPSGALLWVAGRGGGPTPPCCVMPRHPARHAAEHPSTPTPQQQRYMFTYTPKAPTHSANSGCLRRPARRDNRVVGATLQRRTTDAAGRAHLLH